MMLVQSRAMTWSIWKNICQGTRQTALLASEFCRATQQTCTLLMSAESSSRKPVTDQITTTRPAASSGPVEQKLWKRIHKGDPALAELLKSAGTRSKITKLAEVLDCDESSATELVKGDSSLLVGSDVVFRKIKLIKSHGFSASDIISNHPVLHRTFDVLHSRLSRLKEEELLNPPGLCLHALKESDKIFEVYFERRVDEARLLAGFQSIVHFLSDIFDCDVTTTEKLMKENKFLDSTSVVLLKNKMDILKRFGIGCDVVRENVIILQHTSVEKLSTRLRLIHDRKFTLQETNPSLSHLLTCSEDDFLRAFNLLSEKQEAIDGLQDKMQYLQHRLGCSESEARQLTDTHPVNGVSEIKLRKMLDFFLEEMCVSPQFVMRHKKLMTYSVSRLRHRWQILRDAGEGDVDSLPAKLKLSERRFEKLYGVRV